MGLSEREKDEKNDKKRQPPQRESHPPSFLLRPKKPFFWGKNPFFGAKTHTFLYGKFGHFFLGQKKKTEGRITTFYTTIVSPTSI